MWSQPTKIRKNINKQSFRKKVKNWSQSASSIHETKQASQMLCCNNYWRVLVVKCNQQGTERLKYMVYPKFIIFKGRVIKDSNIFKSSNDSLFLYVGLYRRFHMLLSTGKNSNISLIYMIEIWLLFKNLQYSILFSPEESFKCQLGKSFVH